MERPAVEHLPIEPLFVDRVTELATLTDVIRLLPRTIRRHTALLGLRRIDKALLLDEVRRRHPTMTIARLDVDAIVTSPEHFARAAVSETLAAVLRARAERTYITETDDGLRAAAANLNLDLELAVTDLLDSSRTGAHGRLLESV